jgi:hypothetical protein
VECKAQAGLKHANSEPNLPEDARKMKVRLAFILDNLNKTGLKHFAAIVFKEFEE